MRNKLRHFRKLLGKTQAEVAKEVKVVRRLYQRYEYGTSSPTVETAIKMARALNSTVEEIWEPHTLKHEALQKTS